jgi:hypothetical protein
MTFRLGGNAVRRVFLVQANSPIPLTRPERPQLRHHLALTRFPTVETSVGLPRSSVEPSRS